MARALEVPVYKLFHEGDAAPSVRKVKNLKDSDEWGNTGADAGYLSKLSKLLAKIDPNDQKLLLLVAQKVVRRS
jgi:hypothetical protein